MSSYENQFPGETLQTLTREDLPGWRVRIVGLRTPIPAGRIAYLLEYHWVGCWHASNLQTGYLIVTDDMFEAMSCGAEWLKTAKEKAKNEGPPTN